MDIPSIIFNLTLHTKNSLTTTILFTSFKVINIGTGLSKVLPVGVGRLTDRVDAEIDAVML